ncbi:MAG: HDOD domain-containing protein [Armatimonadetes bacterium]|nr:HDOD domain-containing protein [Armatimonadota bacterium]
MVAKSEVLPKSPQEVVQNLGEIAMLPQVVMKVLDMTSNTRATTQELEDVIGQDQGLTSKVLTLANSSYYGLPRRVSSLREAVMFLGFRAVRNIAMTASCYNLFIGKSDSQSLLKRRIWKHSVDTSLLTRLVCAFAPDVVPDEAFAAGLLHDIGKTVLEQYYPQATMQVVQTAERLGIRHHEAEEQILGFNHADLGLALALHWNLPTVLAEALGYHHYVPAASVAPKLVAVVAIASDIANLLESGATEENWLSAINEDARKTLAITPEQIETLIEGCRVEVERSAGLHNMAA